MCDAADVALVDIAGDETPAQLSRSFVFGGVGDLLGPILLIGVVTDLVIRTINRKLFAWAE